MVAILHGASAAERPRIILQPMIAGTACAKMPAVRYELQQDEAILDCVAYGAGTATKDLSAPANFLGTIFRTAQGVLPDTQA
jgi:hypothetical protein